jgi:hypothetical protein
MRLSLKKAAYVAVDQSSVVGNPEFARDDKGWGSYLPGPLFVGPKGLESDKERASGAPHLAKNERDVRHPGSVRRKS